jgi:hypothetical protein
MQSWQPNKAPNDNEPTEGNVRLLQLISPTMHFMLFAPSNFSRETFGKLKLPVVFIQGVRSINLYL